MKRAKLIVRSQTIRRLDVADMSLIQGGNIHTRTGCNTAFTCPSDVGCVQSGFSCHQNVCPWPPPADG